MLKAALTEYSEALSSTPKSAAQKYPAYSQAAQSNQVALTNVTDT